MTIGERVPLTRQRVVVAALDFIDRRGVAALSMRKLGTEVGVEAMSLYNHVSSKEDLLDGVASRLLELVTVPDPPLPDWRDQARAIATSVRDIGLAHPHAFPLLVERHLASLDSWAPMVAAFDLCRAAGLSDQASAGAVQGFSAYVVGAVLLELHRSDQPDLTVDEVPEDRPALRDYLASQVDIAPEASYLRGIDLLIAGVEHQVAPVD